MRTEQHYRNMLSQNPNASIGFTLAAAMVYAARYGVCEPEHYGTDEWASIARHLKSEYGETLEPDQVTVEMDKANRSAAAAALGHSTSPAKTAAARENAKKGGWPKGKARKPKIEICVHN